MWHFFHLEMVSSWRRLGEILQVAAFYGLVVLFFVLSQPPGIPATAEKSGILWASIIIIFAVVQHRMFARDFLSGMLEQWLLMPLAMEWLILLKCAAHWLLVVVPLLLVTPVLAMMLGLEEASLPYLMLALAAGMAALVMLGGIAAAAGLAFRSGEIIVILLILPMALPILILGSIATAKPEMSSEMTFLFGYLLCLIPLSAYTTARLIRYACE